MKALGIDVGSLTTKAVILGNDGILASCIVHSDDDVESSAKAAMEEVLNLAGVSLNNDLYSVSTGVNERGHIIDWVNHDKCASGTGVFLQQMAKLMQMPVEEMSKLSLQAKSKADISGTCAVFAESEVISHVHRDPPTPKEEIIAGIHFSVVSRIISLCKRIGIERDVAVVGGVALNAGFVKIIEEEMGFGILVPDRPQIVAALGAAVIARENIEKGAM